MILLSPFLLATFISISLTDAIEQKYEQVKVGFDGIEFIGDVIPYLILVIVTVVLLRVAWKRHIL